MLDMGFIPDIERICKMLPLRGRPCSSPPPCRPRSSASPASSCTRRCASRPRRRRAPPRSIVQRWCAPPTSPRPSARCCASCCASRARSGTPSSSPTARPPSTARQVAQAPRLQCRRTPWRHGPAGPLKTLEAFRNGEITYLIASDVAARGLDIPEVSHVFNFDTHGACGRLRPPHRPHRPGGTRRLLVHAGLAEGDQAGPRHRAADQARFMVGYASLTHPTALVCRVG
jgi:hypothetical protein